MGDTTKEQYWAIILGASSGFGAATALKLAEEGYNIIGLHLDRQATMPKVAQLIKDINAFGVESIFLNHNAADEAKRKEVIRKLTNRDEGVPKIKVLMHSLAFGTLRPLIAAEGEKSLTQAQMEMTLDVMANSLVYWTQDLVANGLLCDKARVFAMTSSGSQSVIPFYGAVSAAKAALESHVRQLSYELGPRQISVNAIMAGVTDTPALRKIPGAESMVEVARRKNPHQRLTTPEDVAKVISLLCRDGGEWVSGGIVHADGGEGVVNFVGQGKPVNDSMQI